MSLHSSRQRDTTTHFRTLIFAPCLFALAIFLGWLAYATAGQFPFTIGTTVLLSVLSMISLGLALLMINGIVTLEADQYGMY